MKKSNSNQVFPKYEYIAYCIVLIFGTTYLTYNSYNGFWISLFFTTEQAFSGLLHYLWVFTNDDIVMQSTSRMIFWILPVLPIFVAGARNFSPPYSTFIRFYFVSNIMGYIFFMVLEMLLDDYGIGGEVIFYAILISILILHLNIILSKNPIVKGIDNLTIKLPSSSGSSSLGDDLD